MTPDPSSPHALLAAALRLHETGETDAALAVFQDIAQKHPSTPEAWSCLGTALKQRGHASEAVACLRTALSLRPECAATHNNLANLFQETRQYKLALAHYGKALDINPALREAACNRAKCLAASGNEPEAEKVFNGLVAGAPADFSPLFGRGVLFLNSGRPVLAEADFRASLAIRPDDAKAWGNLGSALVNQNRLDEAEAALARSIALDPALAEPRWNMALTKLRAGKYAEGWPLHEARKELPEYPPRFLGEKAWGGAPMPGGTLLLYAEQGLGDTLQFIRYAALARERCARVVVGCQPPLRSLVATVPGVDAVFCNTDEIPPHDAVCALPSLPWIFGTTPETVPSHTPYVRASPSRVPLPPRDSRPRVGFVWSGSPTHAQDRLRSIPLGSWTPILSAPDIRFFSLQKGPAAAALARSPFAGQITDLDPALHDFSDTASAVAQLDLVIAVDTSVAHLAGALGVPVWILLQHAPDWRWMLGRTDTPWYPSATLFRQESFGEWGRAIGQVADALAEWSARRP